MSSTSVVIATITARAVAACCRFVMLLCAMMLIRCCCYAVNKMGHCIQPVLAEMLMDFSRLQA